jgi:broad specificity phosphatase PhoE
VTSPFLRARQTAEPVLKRFPAARHEEWPVNEFTYLSRSLGHRSTTIEERKPLVEAYWNHWDEHYIDGEGAESFVGFRNRVLQLIDRLKNAREEFIVIFSHGQFMLAVLTALMGTNLNDMRQFRNAIVIIRVPNGAIVKITVRADGEMWFSPFSTAHIPLETQSQ